MKVVVGSANPAKLEAVQSAFVQVWPTRELQLEGINVESGVSEQPLSDREMIKGAKKRAQVALTQVEAADYGVGLEGGLHKIDIDWFGRSWIAIVDASGKLGLASSVSCYIPPPMMKLIDEGKTMSEVCEILYGRKDIGKQEGYFGLLTNNHITRAKGYSEAVVMALSTFMSAEPK